MTMISMNVVWEDTVAFLRREAGLVIPLALATSLVGNVVNSLVNPAVLGSPPNALFSLLTFVALLWTVIGQLAIIALVLRPGSSVGEALSLAARRLPTLLGTAFLIGTAATLFALPALIGFFQSGVNPNIPATYTKLPGWVSLYFLVFACVAIWVSLRLSTLYSLIVDKQPGVIASLKTAFAMTRGVIARLILAAIVYFITTIVLTTVVRFVLGSAFELLGRAIDSPFVTVALTALAVGTVTAALSTFAAVFLAMLYRRLNNGI
ncbi:hypothetical protein D3Y57_16385 [Sphingomonas paeninsulae]|jgi:hypothetical protein|uniref:Glycerophosphoryl diester phosphodiesterase membrane domain-containing protein n=1 Tax=Sphingomonas paeninsulae TaxID=2319844 RepID=A0A494TIP4_SPHPE|nr:hypothetical protein [Sphingomonas paeninsulae]AYJ87222.1 hypothetical protein D3Y57_16385 [Sphingomonas paeninsulae]